MFIFQSVTRRLKIIVVLLEDIEEINDKGDNMKDWLEKYPGASEDIYEGLPEPRGDPSQHGSVP